MNYIGNELGLFAHATRWKRYWSAQVKPYIRGRVLDVGCGLGANAAYLARPEVSSYTFLEPDGELLRQVPQYVPKALLDRCEYIQGTTEVLGNRLFDTILYIDVIEHIADSTKELARAHQLLAPGGHLIILVPAHAFLFSPLDTALGHHRRYSRALLRNELPPHTGIVQLFHLDSLGVLLSLANRLLLRKALPTPSQIRFWDGCIVPLSMVVDRLIGHRFGRSLVAVVKRI